MPEVAAASIWNWMDTHYAPDPEAEISVIGVDQNYTQVDDSIEADAATVDRWTKEPAGILLEESLAKKYSLSAGGKVSFTSALFARADGEPWTFVIAGTYKPIKPAALRQTGYVHWEYVDRGVTTDRQGRVQLVFCRVKPGISNADAAQRIDDRFKGESIRTKTTDYDGFRKKAMAESKPVFAIALTLAGLIGLLGVLIAANTAAIIVRENRRHYAVLTALGFEKPTVLAVVAGKVCLMSLTGGVLGVILGWILVSAMIAPAMNEAVGGVGWPGFLTPVALGAWVLLSAAMGLGFGLLATRGQVTNALRFAG
jgi:hypothetical protein